MFGVADRRRKSLMAVALPKRVDPVAEDAAVQFWLARLPDSRLIYLGQMRRFLAWLVRQEGWKDSTVADPIPDLKVDLSTPEKCQEMMEKVKALEAAGQLDPARAKAMIGTIQNTLRLVGK